MPRETYIEKGRRYVSEGLKGRLTVHAAKREGVLASCKGDGAVYSLGWSIVRGWWCSCPAQTRCAHLHALGLIYNPKHP